MTKRPICLMFLILVLTIYILNFFNINLNKNSFSYENKFLNKKNITIAGTIKNKDIKDETTQIVLKDNLISKKIKLRNLILIFKNKSIEKEKLHIGEKIYIKGTIEKITKPNNDGEFNGYIYFGTKNIFYKVNNPQIIKTYNKVSSLYNFVSVLKEKAKENLQLRTGNFYGVYKGITMGDTSSINKGRAIIFREAGISHLFAVSGLHLSIIGCILFWIIIHLRIHRFVAVIIVAFMLLFFGVFVGNSLSAIRGISMFVAGSLGQIIGRKNDMPQIMSMAGILIILQSPLSLYSPSFYLSFMAVFAVSIYGRKIIDFYGFKSKIIKSFISIISVFILTFPIMSYFFGEVSIVGIFLNFIIIPTAFIVLLCGIIIMICGKIFILCVIPVIIGNTLIFLYEKISFMAIKLPFSTLITGRCSFSFIIIYYILVIGSLIIFSIRLKHYKGKFPLKKLGAIIMIIIITFGLFFSYPETSFSICTLNIYKGNCKVIILPNHHCIIYNCGSKKAKNIFLNTVLPFLKIKGIKYIDGFILSSNSPYNLSGLKELCTLLEEETLTIKVKNVFFNGELNHNVVSNLCKRAGIKLYLYDKSLSFTDNGCNFYITRGKLELNYIDLMTTFLDNNIQVSIKGLNKIELKNNDFIVNSTIVGNLQKNGEIDIVYKKGNLYLNKMNN